MIARRSVAHMAVQSIDLSRVETPAPKCHPDDHGVQSGASDADTADVRAERVIGYLQTAPYYETDIKVKPYDS